MPKISPEKIEEIKSAVRIEEVIGQYVELKKSGANLIGICPFHGGKSFTVNPSKNIYKCFGCNKGGKAITFLMESQHKTFPEALQILADQFNILIP